MAFKDKLLPHRLTEKKLEKFATESAGYGCLVAFANRLDHDDDGAVLQECLENTYDGDRTMTAIATGGVNAEAA